MFDIDMASTYWQQKREVPGKIHGRRRGSIRGQLAAAVVASMALTLGSASGALAHGCGTTDHVVGLAFHYYEGHFNSQNSHFHRWWEVNLGSGAYNYTWCGCVNPDLPCVYAPTP